MAINRYNNYYCSYYTTLDIKEQYDILNTD